MKVALAVDKLLPPSSNFKNSISIPVGSVAQENPSEWLAYPIVKVPSSAKSPPVI